MSVDKEKEQRVVCFQSPAKETTQRISFPQRRPIFGTILVLPKIDLSHTYLLIVVYSMF